MLDLEALIHQVRLNGHDVWIAGPASESSLLQLEEALGVTLPESYRQFIEKYGAIAIYDSSISGILHDTPLDVTGGSLYGDTCNFRERWSLPSHLLVIEPDEDAPYCLDTSARSNGGELPVICFDLHTRWSERIAASFDEWLERYYFHWAR